MNPDNPRNKPKEVTILTRLLESGVLFPFDSLRSSRELSIKAGVVSLAPILRPGVGFRLVPGAMSHVEDSGSGSNKKSFPVDVSALPYGPEGLGNTADNLTLARLLGRRYYGGNITTQVPQGWYSENRWKLSTILENMHAARLRGENVNQPGWFMFEGKPEDFDGKPTNGEQVDVSYTSRRNRDLDRWAASSSGGTGSGSIVSGCITPMGSLTPKQCSYDPLKPVLMRVTGSPYRYIAVEQPNGNLAFFKNNANGARGRGPNYPDVILGEPGVEDPPIVTPPIVPSSQWKSAVTTPLHPKMKIRMIDLPELIYTVLAFEDWYILVEKDLSSTPRPVLAITDRYGWEVKSV